MNNTSAALDWRYATKRFDTKKKLSSEKLNLILEAGLKAPSSMNFQPWKFIVVEDRNLREKIYQAGHQQPKILEASHLIALTTKTKITRDDALRIIEATKDQRHTNDTDLQGFKEMVTGAVPTRTLEWSKRQTYIALGFMLLAAAVEEVDAGPMEGFDATKVDKILELTDYTTTVLVALGYRSQDDTYAQLPKVRFPREEVVIIK